MPGPLECGHCKEHPPFPSLSKRDTHRRLVHQLTVEFSGKFVEREDGCFACPWCQVFPPTEDPNVWRKHVRAEHPEGGKDVEVEPELPTPIKVKAAMSSDSESDDTGYEATALPKVVRMDGPSAALAGPVVQVNSIEDGILLTTRFLRSHSIIVNSVDRVVICTSCEQGFPEDDVVQHVAKHQTTRHVPVEEAQQLQLEILAVLARCPAKTDIPLHDPERDLQSPSSPVRGVPVVLDGSHCKSCGTCGSGPNFKKNHRSRCKTSEFKRSSVQVIRLKQDGPSRILIRDAEEAHAPSGLLAALKAQQAEVELAVRQTDVMSEELETQHAFNSKLRWYDFLKHRSPADLMASIKQPQVGSDSILSRVGDHVSHLVSNHWKESGGQAFAFEFILRKHIGMGDGNPFEHASGDNPEIPTAESVGKRSNRPFNYITNAATQAKYARQITGLAVHALRTAPEPEDYIPPIDAETLPVGYKYPGLLLKPLANKDSAPDEMHFPDFAFPTAQLDAASDARAALREESIASKELHSERDKAALQALQKSSRLALLRLLKSTFLREHRVFTSTGTCVLQRFVICLALNKTGGYRRADLLSSDLAMVEYGARLMALFDMLDRAKRPDIDHLPADQQPAAVQRLVSAMDGACTAFSLLRECVWVVRDQATRMPDKIQVHWVEDDHPESTGFGTAFVSGRETSVQKIRDGAREMVVDATSTMQELLLQVVDVSGLASSLASVNSESAASLAVGSCFLDDNTNKSRMGFDAEQHDLLHQLDAAGRLNEFFGPSPSNPAKWVVKESRAKAYLATSEHLTRLLLLLIHFTTIAGRGTETASQVLRRTADQGSCLRVVGGHLAIETIKNKTGDKPIVRFPSPVVSRLLIQYLLVIRPFELVLANELHPGMTTTRQTSLWVTAGSKPYTAVNVRSTIEMAGARYFKGSLTMRNFRQLWAAMLYRYLGYQSEFKLEFVTDEQQQVIAQQMGHSDRTHTHNYGVTEGVWHMVRDNKADGWKKANGALHDLLEIESVSPRLPARATMAAPPPNAPERAVTPPETPNVRKRGIDLSPVHSSQEPPPQRARHAVRMSQKQASPVVQTRVLSAIPRVVDLKDLIASSSTKRKNKGNKGRVLVPDTSSSLTPLVATSRTGENIDKDDVQARRIAVANFPSTSSLPSHVSSSSAIAPMDVDPVVALPAALTVDSSSAVFKTSSSVRPVMSSQPSSQEEVLWNAITATALHVCFEDEASQQPLTWTSDGQRRSMKAFLSGNQDVLSVLPTGSGKTALALGPALFDAKLQPRLSVFVAPTRVLKDEMIQRCLKTGLDTHIFPVKTPTGEPVRSGRGLVGILIVTAEFVGTKDFQLFLEAAHVSRIVIDEAHMFVTARHFREGLGRIGLIRRKAVPLVLLTATLPPDMLQPLAELVNAKLDPAINVIRLSAFRANISFDQIKINSASADVMFFECARQLRKILDGFMDHLFAGGGKALVFCKSKETMWRIAQSLGRGDQVYCSPSLEARDGHARGDFPTAKQHEKNHYISQEIESIDNLAAFASSQSNEKPILIATTGLLQAMDDPVSSFFYLCSEARVRV